MANLPAEVWSHVISFADLPTLASIARVSSSFKQPTKAKISTIEGYLEGHWEFAFEADDSYNSYIQMECSKVKGIALVVLYIHHVNC